MYSPVTHPEEYSRRRADAIDARRQWIQSLIDGKDHHFVSIKWQIYVDLVHHAGDLMGGFEQWLQIHHPYEYNFVNEYKRQVF